MNRDEAKKLAEEHGDMLAKYFVEVRVREEADEFYCYIIDQHGVKIISTTRFPFDSYPPQGEVCEVWDDDNINSDDDKRWICVSIGDGNFSATTKWGGNVTGIKWDNWRSLGVNINDK